MATSDRYRRELANRLESSAPEVRQFLMDELRHQRDMEKTFARVEVGTLCGAWSLAVLGLGAAVWMAVAGAEWAAGITAVSDIAAVAVVWSRRSYFIVPAAEASSSDDQSDKES